jgi:hypothetical protein
MSEPFSKNQIEYMVNRYAIAYLKECLKDVTPKQATHQSEYTSSEHCLWMVQDVHRRLVTLMKEGEHGKIGRWIGYAHGIVVSNHLGTVEDLSMILRNVKERPDLYYPEYKDDYERYFPTD